MNGKMVAALILAAVAGSALAAAPAFEDVDTDTDGRITMDEAAAVEGLDFDAADTNGDNTLDREEYAAAASQL